MRKRGFEIVKGYDEKEIKASEIMKIIEKLGYTPKEERI